MLKCFVVLQNSEKHFNNLIVQLKYTFNNNIEVYVFYLRIRGGIMRFFLLFKKVILVCIILSAIEDVVIAQNIKGLSSIEFYNNYRNLLSDSNVIIIDGRTEAMFSSERLKNAVNIDADSDKLGLLLKQYKNYQTMIIYCTTIRRTIKIIETLSDFYCGKIIYINDGIAGWKRNGLPIDTG